MSTKVIIGKEICMFPHVERLDSMKYLTKSPKRTMWKHIVDVCKKTPYVIVDGYMIILKYKASMMGGFDSCKLIVYDILSKRPLKIWTLPTIKISINEEDNKHVEIDNINKSPNITGDEAVNLARQLAKQLGASNVSLHDGANISCDNYLLRLSISGVLSTGMTYYERKGFVSSLKKAIHLKYRAHIDTLLKQIRRATLGEYVDELVKLERALKEVGCAKFYAHSIDVDGNPLPDHTNTLRSIECKDFVPKKVLDEIAKLKLPSEMTLEELFESTKANCSIWNIFPDATYSPLIHYHDTPLAIITKKGRGPVLKFPLMRSIVILMYSITTQYKWYSPV